MSIYTLIWTQINNPGYRGGANTTVNGNQCLKWEDAVNDKKATKETRLFTIENFPVLSGGHKFCRNPVNAAVFPEVSHIKQ